MNRHHIDLVQRSFGLVELDRDRAGDAFVGRLADIDAALAGALRHDPVAALGAIVGQLDDDHELVRHVQHVAEEHLRTGGSVDDFAHVRISALWAIEQVLGGSYTADVRNAWAGVSRTVLAVMVGAAALEAAELD